MLKKLPYNVRKWIFYITMFYVVLIVAPVAYILAIGKAICDTTVVLYEESKKILYEGSKKNFVF